MNLSNFGLVPHETESAALGDRYGRLVVQAVGKVAGTYRYKAICLCDCGKTIVTAIDSLNRGRAKSCGCARLEAVTKHGRWNHPLYTVLRSMKSRCYNPSDKRYADYGGRGIAICDRWHDIDNFITDMEPSYFDGATIERANVNGNYEPGNCTWVTAAAQQSNKRSNIELTYNGKTQCLAHWAEEVGLTYGTLWTRIKTQKWDAERALTTPALSADERCELARAQCAENRANK
ncbi:hypothetical protein R6138_04367 [Ralstonia thomasii]|uniref:hypothetical protein n=1 Tax=Ralstonia thomasii TaxID=3058596 RepID=UPI0028F52677|nr:hypothetical protein [Ralstonia sp. LMG 18095]CAJ0899732.1 hypothetical protein R6138_04367 [Ralstonia sp. LMG 18095]